MSTQTPSGVAAGWYLLTAAGLSDAGELWLTGRDSTGAEVRIPLSSPVDGTLRRLVPLARATRELRLATLQGLVSAGFQLDAIGKMAALGLLLRGFRNETGKRDWSLASRTLWRAGLRVLAGDVTGSGDMLVAAYLRQHATGALCLLSEGWRRRRARWAPLEQLETRIEQGSREAVWETLGDDPKTMLVADGLPVALPAGWYLLELSLVRKAGQLIAPALYPEYEAAPRPDDMIELPTPGVDGRVDMLVMFKHKVRRLRFDPTCRQARFAFDRARMKRICRAHALLRMLSVRREDGSNDWASSARNMVGFLHDARRRGMSEAAVTAFVRYQRSQADAVRTYAGWVRRYDTLGPAERKMLTRRVGRLGKAPLFSVLLPLYETPERWLRACIESVLDQAWPHWELCIVDDASPSPHVRRVVESYAARDSRIRFSVRDRNGHISVASNTALDMANGDYVVLLDHDDLLRPHALLEFAEAISENESLDLLYSDEDKVDEQGRRFDPYFKPDWNPDLLLGQNYVCHLTTLRASLVRAVGGFREGLEGSQDHDLVLRCTQGQGLDSARIRHIPKILYHWRAIPGSTALEREAKDYAGEAGALAVQKHVASESTGARVEQLEQGHYRVHWPLPDPAPKVSLIVPTRDRPDLLRTCVDSLLSMTEYPDFELLLVDNGSADPEALSLLAGYAEHAKVRVLRDATPFNYSALNNLAAREANGSVLALVNNDIEVITPDWLTEMVGQAMRRGVGAVGAMLLYPDDRIQHAGVILGLGGIANHAWVGEPAGIGGHGGRARVAQTLSAVTGACLVVRKALYLEVGGLDERLRVAFNDIDFCLRLGQAGYRCIWTPFARLYHHESASRGGDGEGEKRERFLQEIALMQDRWGTLLDRDPAYNPNLSLAGRGFDLADPPRI